MPDWLHCKHFALLFAQSELGLCAEAVAPVWVRVGPPAEPRHLLHAHLARPDFLQEWEKIDGREFKA